MLKIEFSLSGDIDSLVGFDIGRSRPESRRADRR